jgi:transposase-like protein
MTGNRIQSGVGESAATVRAKRKFRSRLERRKIAEEALKPGASVANVAKRHGVRPNQVRHWRALYSQGLLNDAGANALLPVTISGTAGKEPVGSMRRSSTSESPAAA